MKDKDTESIDKEIKKERSDWDEKFEKEQSKEDKEILIPDVFEDESFEEWE